MAKGDLHVLSLDGGGTGALVQLMALRRLYPKAKSGHDVLRQFDYAAANSGGALVLGGLVADLDLTAVEDDFLSGTLPRRFFTPTSRLSRPQRWLGAFSDAFDPGPKYEMSAKRNAIDSLLGAAGQRPIRICADEITAKRQGRRFDSVMTAFDYDRQRAYYARSNVKSHAAGGTSIEDIRLLDAVNASTNAPTPFFDIPTSVTFDAPPPRTGRIERRFWDGAMAGNNNPILAALVELVANWQQRRPSPDAAIHVLSIGTCATLRPPQRLFPKADRRLVDAHGKTFVEQIRVGARAIVSDPPDAASFIAHVMLSLPHAHKAAPATIGALVRLNPLVKPKPVDASAHPLLAEPTGGRISIADFDRLAAMSLDARSDADIQLLAEYTRLWMDDLAPNQGIQEDVTSLAQSKGHATFSAARDAWRALE